MGGDRGSGGPAVRPGCGVVQEQCAAAFMQSVWQGTCDPDSDVFAGALMQ
jgi:hypothetical protein